MYGQIQNRYPNGLADEIIGNCDTRLGLGMTDVLSAEYFCDLIGVATVETTSIRKDNSIEGEIEQYGQKSISTIERNLLNVDEILRMPSNKLLVNLRGNKPLLLDKVIYTEHPLSKKLKDSLVSEYKPNWTKNHIENNKTKSNKKEEKNEPKPKEKLGWDNF